MQEKILRLLQENARLTNRQIAVLLDTSEEEVAAAVAQYEKDGTIKGYQAVIDWEKVEPHQVSAMIEMKVSPKRDSGFNEIAQRIMEFDEVDSVYLMAGGYDLLVGIRGSSLQEISMFVTRRLATLEGVLATATHFLLAKYKENGVNLSALEVTEKRGMVL